VVLAGLQTAFGPRGIGAYIVAAVAYIVKTIAGSLVDEYRNLAPTTLTLSTSVQE
jgi:hypothetical protein